MTIIVRKPWLSSISLFVFATGYALTVEKFPNNAYQYAGLMVVALLSIRLAELRLAHVLSVDAALWMSGLVIFSSYYLKFFLIALDPDSPVRLGMVPRLAMGEFDWAATQMTALSICTVGVVGWALTVFLLPADRAALSTHPASRHSEISAVRVAVMFIAAIGLSVGSSWVSYVYDIGLAGGEIQQVLPLKLRGVVFHLRLYFLPCLILLATYFAYRSRHFTFVWLGGFLLFINGFADLVIKSSKSALFWPGLLLLLLVITTEVRFRLRYAFVVLTGAFALLLFLPYMHAIRAARVAGEGAWMSLVVAASSAEFAPVSLILKSITWIVYRLPGIEIISAILGHSGLPIESAVVEVFASLNGVAGYLTNNIFLTPVSHQHLAAPGYFGWWYLVFGLPGVFFGGVVLGLLVRVVWPKVLGSRLEVVAVARVFALAAMFIMLSEGTIDSMTKILVAMVGTIVVLEVYARFFVVHVRKSSFKPKHRSHV